MKKILLLFPVLLLLMGAQNVKAGQYSVNVGASTNIYCTADAPNGGWITHAFYELADASDAKYLAVYSHSSECYATVTGISAKSSIKIQVTYTYSYRGSYDDKIHVGHGTYYDYVTVKGGGAATGFRFNPTGVDMKVGETVKVKIEMTPANSSSTYEWGVIETLSSRPSSYEITKSGDVLSITAKRAMSLYLSAETSNGLTATCVIYAKEETPDDAIIPTDISIVPQDTVIKEGNTAKLDYTLTPDNASTAITWTSSNENICKVNSQGELTALQSGQAVITATTSNGLTAKCNVTVSAQVQKVTLPKTEKVTIGYQLKLLPTTTPTSAIAEWEWQSSDDAIASVDANGIVSARREGSAKITVKAKGTSISDVCTITVNPASQGTDIRNVSLRLQNIEKVIEQVINRIK